ncbi:MAG: hypothetical protein U0X73_14905 [Thermoanaerobaculia bacterium]
MSGSFDDQPPESPLPPATGETLAPGWSSPPAAVYGLEQPARCPTCRQEIDQLYVVRMYRARVNFMSSLPRSGRILVCPRCKGVVPGELGAVI